MKIDLLQEKLQKGILDDKLLALYGDAAEVSLQRERYGKLLKTFEERYGSMEAGIFSAPGRSEIGGNHTDHQQGEVLAAAIHFDAIAVAAATEDGTVSVYSEGYGEVRFHLNDVSPEAGSEKGTTASLVKGVLAGLQNRGYKVGGFCACITSDVPGGSGLSSSAAYETLIGTILSGLYNHMEIPGEVIAMTGQYAENVFFGKPCGLMDQMASAIGGLVHIDFARPDKPVWERIEYDFDKSGYCLCITETLGSHADLTDEYAAVPAEMKAVAGFFGKEILRDVTLDMLYTHASAIREKCGDRALLRSLHFVTENARVRKEAEALRNADIQTFLQTLQMSGNSSYQYLQNIYSSREVTKQNLAVALCFTEIFGDGVGAFRVHGGGFAGTIQTFVKKEQVMAYREYMEGLFGAGTCKVLRIRPAGGVCFIR